MTAPTPDPTKVLVGVGYLWTGPENTAAPADPTGVTGLETMPSDWSSPYVYAGATDAGVTITFAPSMTDVNIEEQLLPALRVPNKAEFTIACALAEDTIENMKTAYGRGTLTTTAAGAGQPGKTVLALSDNTYDKVALGFEGINTFGFPRRFYIPSAMSTATVGTPYRRASKRLYPVTFSALCALSSILITDYTAEPTA